jgi:hypothetical protein
MSNTSKLRVAIWFVECIASPFYLCVLIHLLLSSGAGIGGLALAIVIGKFNPHLTIDLYEAGPEISTVGAGISLWRRTWEIAQYVGLDQALFEKSMSSPCKYYTFQPFPPILWGDAAAGWLMAEITLVEGITLRRADQPQGRNFGLLASPSKFVV